MWNNLVTHCGVILNDVANWCNNTDITKIFFLFCALVDYEYIYAARVYLYTNLKERKKEYESFFVLAQQSEKSIIDTQWFIYFKNILGKFQDDAITC